MTGSITGETWGYEIERVKAYLAEEASRPFSELRTKLESARRELLAALAGVSDAQAEFRPGTGEGEHAWGIAEVLRHIASIETIMANRVRQLGLGLPVDLQATYAGYMESVDTRRLNELTEVLSESYRELLEAVGAIEGHEHLDTYDTHRRFGALNCRSWLAMHTLHLSDHARQIEKLKSLPGYPSA